MFLLATFIAQVTMLNMIIAIMGNTFDKVIEKKEMHAMNVKLSILSEYRHVINLVNRKRDYANFIFMVAPIIDEDELEASTDWEGGFNFLRKALFRRIDTLEKVQQRSQ